MARSSPWASKVLALIDAGNHGAALAQIKVAPSVRDLQALQAQELALADPGASKERRHLRAAIADNLALLAAPRLHRSP